MNVLDFINSTALSDHLEKIGYKFSGLEAAWLVYNSNRATLDAKLAAWREIIDTYPDEPFRTWWGTKDEKLIRADESKSMHDVLRRYITLKTNERKFIETDEPFIRGDGKEIPFAYSWSYREPGFDEDVKRGLYPDFASAMIAIKNKTETYDWEYFITVTKQVIDEDRYASVRYNSHGEILDTESRGLFTDDDLDIEFDDLWFGFPTPFKKGDIL